jgi:putative transposase
MSLTERKAMIRKYYANLIMTKKCKLLNIFWSSLYYTPVDVNAETLKLMSKIDQLFTKYPLFRCPAGHCAAMAQEGAAARSLNIRQ